MLPQPAIPAARAASIAASRVGRMRNHLTTGERERAPGVPWQASLLAAAGWPQALPAAIAPRLRRGYRLVTNGRPREPRPAVARQPGVASGVGVDVRAERLDLRHRRVAQ